MNRFESAHARVPRLLLRAMTVGTALGTALLLASPAVSAQGAPKRGGTAIFALGNDPATANPAITATVGDVTIGCNIYEGLTSVTRDSDVKPMLAKSWTLSDDGRTYSFDLRAAKWHDGKPFTSEDVKFSLLEVNSKLGSIFSAAGALIQTIDTPAPDKVVITLKEPFGPMLISLSCIGGGAILPAHVFKGTDIRRNPATTATPIGTGAFKLGQWQRGSQIKLVRNPDYWDPAKPYLDEVIARILPQAASRVQALRAGEVDLIMGYNMVPSDFAIVKSDAKLKLEVSGYAPATGVLAFNVNKKPLDDVRVRRALFMATDRDYLVKAAWFGEGYPSTGPYNDDIKWIVNPQANYTKLYPFDVARANKTLDDAGFARQADGNRFTVKVSYPSDAPDRAQVAQALKAMWRAAGVNLELESLERPAHLKRVFQDATYDMTIESYNTFGDPALGITRMYSTLTKGKTGGNSTGYSNPAVDALFDKGAKASSQAERGKLYRDAAAILANDLPLLTLRERRFTDASVKKLHGLWDAMGPGDWSSAWLSER